MLEQLLICCIYAAARVREQALKFNDVLVAVKEVLGLSLGPF
jgi:hypothetical protein